LAGNGHGPAALQVHRRGRDLMRLAVDVDGSDLRRVAEDGAVGEDEVRPLARLDRAQRAREVEERRGRGRERGERLLLGKAVLDRGLKVLAELRAVAELGGGEG